jgi:hypothetical protein
VEEPGPHDGPSSSATGALPTDPLATPDPGEATTGAPGSRPGPPVVRQRSELEIRWRQARNAPPPVVRAVLANVIVATVGGVALLLADWLASQGVLPGDLQPVAPLIYVVAVILSGTILTYLWVELPTGRAGERRRSGWSAVLGFFASIPIVYLALVIIFQILRPLFP